MTSPSPYPIAFSTPMFAESTWVTFGSSAVVPTMIGNQSIRTVRRVQRTSCTWSATRT